jgi:hypothetical protein
VLGRQFGFDYEFLYFAAAPGAAVPWQVFFELIGMIAAMVFLRTFIRNHQAAAVDTMCPGKLRYMPILFLACLYIWMFVSG